MNPPLGPYEQLLALAERERDLVQAGRAEELEEVMAARAAVVAELPVRPPREAAELLARALAVQEETCTRLEHDLGSVRAELGRLGRGRGAVRGYTPAPSGGGALSRRG
jgi:hypothetical protein